MVENMNLDCQLIILSDGQYDYCTSKSVYFDVNAMKCSIGKLVLSNANRVTFTADRAGFGSLDLVAGFTRVATVMFQPQLYVNKDQTVSFLPNDIELVMLESSGAWSYLAYLSPEHLEREEAKLRKAVKTTRKWIESSTESS